MVALSYRVGRHLFATFFLFLFSPPPRWFPCYCPCLSFLLLCPTSWKIWFQMKNVQVLIQPPVRLGNRPRLLSTEHDCCHTSDVARCCKRSVAVWTCCSELSSTLCWRNQSRTQGRLALSYHTVILILLHFCASKRSCCIPLISYILGMKWINLPLPILTLGGRMVSW